MFSVPMIDINRKVTSFFKVKISREGNICQAVSLRDEKLSGESN